MLAKAKSKMTMVVPHSKLVEKVVSVTSKSMAKPLAEMLKKA